MTTQATMESRARKMRANPTKAEQALKVYLREHNIPAHVSPQVVFGFYIVDFLIRGRLLVVEVDGSFHDGRAEYDARRTALLESWGLHVIRCTNDEALNTPEVVQERIEQYPLVKKWVGQLDLIFLNARDAIKHADGWSAEKKMHPRLLKTHKNRRIARKYQARVGRGSGVGPVTISYRPELIST